MQQFSPSSLQVCSIKSVQFSSVNTAYPAEHVADRKIAAKRAANRVDGSGAWSGKLRSGSEAVSGVCRNRHERRADISPLTLRPHALRRCRETVLGKLFTPIAPLFTKQQKLVAALLRVAGVTASLTESNGSLPPGL